MYPAKNLSKGFICEDSRPCGGRKRNEPRKGVCMCLESGYKGDTCPFCKPDFRYTNGKYYPHRNSVEEARGGKYSRI